MTTIRISGAAGITLVGTRAFHMAGSWARYATGIWTSPGFHGAPWQDA